MPRPIHVYLLPSHFEPAELRGGIAATIDVLRATTTVAHALANGASRIIPCETVEQAEAIRKRHGAQTLLGGERKGELIPGFDLDNSPTAWSAPVVAGREIAFTTTNGTRALLRADQAERVITAAFANLSAVVALLKADERPVHIVCAGTDGRVAIEDSLLAGAIVSNLESGGGNLQLNDSAVLVRGLWISCAATAAQRLAVISSGLGATNLKALGLDSDIETAAQIDHVDVVPEYLPESRSLQLHDE